jgi:dTDP-4-dehydrorhamnose 3,5-epimerase
MKKRFSSFETELSDLYYIERFPLIDERGSMERIFCSDELVEWNKLKVAQINRTLTKKRGSVRGLHFQFPPSAERKYVMCLLGSVFDVAVDLRSGSETYGKWFGVELNGSAQNALLIPEGFAHGFQTLEDNVYMLYLHSAPFDSAAEAGINSLDPDLAINWPLPVGVQSKRDEILPYLDEFNGITL